jgi:hypothetical protein
MHKKLESDLISLAHSILQMKNKENVFLLKQKSKEIYEKLSVLAFVEEYVNSGPNLKETKEEVLSIVENAFLLKTSKKEEVDEIEKVVHQLEEVLEIKEEIVEEVKVEVKVEEIIEQPFDELEELMHSEEDVKVEIVEEIKIEVKVEEIIEQPFDELEELMLSKEKPIKEELVEKELVEEELVTDFIDDVVKVEKNKILSLEEELQDTISVDQLATLFDLPAPKSLNDRLATNIKIGLNDRIVFVKNLFEGSQEDFNRVVSQLNTYATEKEAKKFIHKMVKPDYDWSQQEELEARFIEIVERKFA